MENTKKITFVSYLRVFAMFMIVFLHSLKYYGGWGYTEHVIPLYQNVALMLNDVALPIFFLISGYLFFLKLPVYNSKIILIKKAKRLLIPYLFWSLLQIAIIPDRYGIEQLPYGVAHLWFLLALFGLFVIFLLTKNIWLKASISQFLLLILLAFFLYYPVSKIDINLFQIKGVVFYSPFFICGMLLSRDTTPLGKINIFKKIVIISISILIFIVSIYLVDNSLKYQLSRFTILIVLFFGIQILKEIKLDKNKIIELLDRNSMGIYIIHHILIMFCLQFECIRLFLNEHFIIGPILIFVLSFLMSLFISIFINSNKYSKIILG